MEKEKANNRGTQEGDEKREKKMEKMKIKKRKSFAIA